MCASIAYGTCSASVFLIIVQESYPHLRSLPLSTGVPGTSTSLHSNHNETRASVCASVCVEGCEWRVWRGVSGGCGGV